MAFGPRAFLGYSSRLNRVYAPTDCVFEEQLFPYHLVDQRIYGYHSNVSSLEQQILYHNMPDATIEDCASQHPSGHRQSFSKYQQRLKPTYLIPLTARTLQTTGIPQAAGTLRTAGTPRLVTAGIRQLSLLRRLSCRRLRGI